MARKDRTCRGVKMKNRFKIVDGKKAGESKEIGGCGINGLSLLQLR